MPRVGGDHAGGDLEERRLARAVAADEAQAFARGDRQLGAVEERRAAEGQTDVLEEKEWRQNESRSAVDVAAIKWMRWLADKPASRHSRGFFERAAGGHDALQALLRTDRIRPIG